MRAPASLAPAAFTLAGWVMVISAAALLVVPLRWHAAYARYWSRTLPLPLVRIAGGAALLMAGGLAWAAWGPARG